MFLFFSYFILGIKYYNGLSIFKLEITIEPTITIENGYSLSKDVAVYGSYDSTDGVQNEVETITFTQDATKKNEFTVGKKQTDTVVIPQTYYAKFTYKYTAEDDPTKVDIDIIGSFTIKKDNLNGKIDPSEILISELGAKVITIRRNKILLIFSNKNN